VASAVAVTRILFGRANAFEGLIHVASHVVARGSFGSVRSASDGVTK